MRTLFYMVATQDIRRWLYCFREVMYVKLKMTSLKQCIMQLLFTCTLQCTCISGCKILRCHPVLTKSLPQNWSITTTKLSHHITHRTSSIVYNSNNNPLSLSNKEGIWERQHNISAHEGWAAKGQTEKWAEHDITIHHNGNYHHAWTWIFFPPLWKLVELHGMLITTAAHNFKM